MKTLLLVDDELENLRSLGEILNRFGYKVIAKPDAPSALSMLHEGTKVRVRETRAGWSRASVGGTDLEGWLPSEAVETVEPARS